jgi:presenilin-like A22 family membrane protease
MEATSVRPGYELWRPNREKAEAKTTKVVVAFVLLVSAVLLLIITIGGWERLQGGSVGAVTIAWAALYVFFAFMVIRWSRGILPVASALAVLMLIFAAVSAPGWFARDKEGLDSPAIPEELIGLLVLIVIPVQLLLVAVAMFGFNQDWHVEEERPVGGEYEEDEAERYRDEDDEADRYGDPDDEPRR